MQKSSVLEIFAVRLRIARRYAGLNVGEIASMIGVTRQTYYFYERGKYLPNLEAALKLSHVLGVSVEWLCGREGGTGNE